MKKEVCTQCLDMLINLTDYPPKHPKDVVKLLGKAIGRYEELGTEIPLKYYREYHALKDKYEPGWRYDGFRQKGISK